MPRNFIARPLLVQSEFTSDDLPKSRRGYLGSWFRFSRRTASETDFLISIEGKICVADTTLQRRLHGSCICGGCRGFAQHTNRKIGTMELSNRLGASSSAFFLHRVCSTCPCNHSPREGAPI